jgi:hypothetical protein
MAGFAGWTWAGSVHGHAGDLRRIGSPERGGQRGPVGPAAAEVEQAVVRGPHEAARR